MQLGLFAVGIEGDREYAQVLATSDRVMKDLRSSEQLPISWTSQWTGIRSMCSALPVYDPKETYASRWKHMVAVPVLAPDLANAPVGAVVLSSTSPDSQLRRVTAGRGLSTTRDKLVTLVYDVLDVAGRQVLSTAPPPGTV